MSFPPPGPKQASIVWFALTAMAVTVLLALLGGFVWALGWLAGKLSAVLLPVALALVLAYILDPVVEFLVRKKIPRIWSILLVFLVGLLIIAAVLGSVIPGLIRESRKLIHDLPKNAEKVESTVDRILDTTGLGSFLPNGWRLTSTNYPGLINKPDEVYALPTDNTQSSTVASAPAKQADERLTDLLTRAVEHLVAWIPTQLKKISGWLESSIGLVLVPICLFYFLLEKQGINRSWADYLPIQDSKAKDELVFCLKAVNECMVVFFRGQVLVALCVGVLLAVGYLVMGLNYAVLLGVVAGVLGIVPYLGTIVSLALAMTVSAIQFGDWKHLFYVLGIAAVVKALEDLVISPKIIGDRSGLHPLTVILAVMIGANLLGGFLGALLAIPLTAALRTLMFRYVWKRRPHKPHAKESASTADIAS